MSHKLGERPSRGVGRDNGGNLWPLVRSVSFAHAALPFASLLLVVPLGGCRSLGGPGAAVHPAADTVVPGGGMGGPRTRAESRLDNGVRVIVEENHAAPVVAVQVWVASGAADDPPALAGAAHLYEHLLFRGTRRRAPGAAEREIAAAGGAVGAWTGLDETVFAATLATPFLDLGLDVLGDAVSAPAFDPGELEQEKRRVTAEIARAALEPARAAADLLRAGAFAGGAAAQPLLGTPATVAAATREALAAHFAETYVGANMTVVVVGDVEAAAARASVARAFAAVPRGRAAARTPAAPPPSGPRALLSNAPGLEPRVAAGFRVEAPGPAAGAALDLIAVLLARGDGSRLARELCDNRQVASAVSGFTLRSRAGALLALELSPAAQRSEAAAEAAIDEALRLGREEVPADELERARAALGADLGRGDDGVEGRARRLGFAAAIAEDERYDARYREALRALDPASLRAAAAKLLRPDALWLAVLDPAAARASSAAELSRLETIVAGAPARREAPVQAASPPVAAGGDVVRAVTPAGLRIIVLRERGAPMVAVEAAWAGGSRAEDAGSNGAGALIAALLTRGTRARSAQQIDDEARALGGRLTGFSDRDHLGVRAELLPASWPRGLALLADCLLRPSFAPDELDDSRRVVVNRGRHRAGDPTRAAQLFDEALWPGHPFRFDPLGTASSLAALGRVRLLEHYRRHYPLGRLVVSVVGDVDPKEAVATLTALFAKAPAGTAPPDPPPPPAHAEPVALFQNTERGGAELVVGYPGPEPRDPDRAALEVLAEILASGGRLDRLYTGRAPLAFHAGARAAAGVAPGYLAVDVGCRPEAVDAVVAAVREILAEMTGAGVSAAETERAARRLAGRRALELRGQVAIADALALDEAYGVGLMSYRQAPAALARVTAADVTRAARRFLDPKRETIAVVRPERPAGARADLGARGDGGGAARAAHAEGTR